MVEKSYKDFSKSAKKGCDKYSRLSSSGMKAYAEKYEKKTGKRACVITSRNTVTVCVYDNIPSHRQLHQRRTGDSAFDTVY